ncbi:tryptophan-rich sensory protein [Erythrobacter sp.]|nr:tryptophan-rich sensory protein [Erythrobacter sp.]
MNILASKAQLRASLLRWSLFLIPLILLLGYISSQFGSADTAWFQSLNKPAIFPPPAAFGIVWAILWVMIGFSLALVASAWGAYGREIALGAFALHFIGTLAWTPVFFGMQEMQAALFVLAYVVVSLIAVIFLFWKVRKTAAMLLMPYLAWTAFAAVLNYQFIGENPDGGAAEQNGAAVEVTL